MRFDREKIRFTPAEYKNAGLYIVTGFLGAGKTTYIKFLLDKLANEGKKTVYIVNEFGETGLDGILSGKKEDEVFELSNGCICCTLKDEICLTIKYVQATINPDIIIFESSGIFLADDFLTLLRTEGVLKTTHIMNVICIVDAQNFRTTPSFAGSVLNSQIKYASTLIVSKLTKETDTEALACDLKNINPSANIVMRPYEDIKDEDTCMLMTPNSSPLRTGRVAAAHKAFSSVSVKPERGFTRTELDSLLSRLTSGSLGEIVRAKGVLDVDGERLFVNVVMRDVSTEPAGNLYAPSFTVIGTRLKRIYIRELFS